MKKFFLLLLLSIVIICLSYILYFMKEFSSFRHIISSYYAKEFCSCYYVLKRDEDFCHNLVRQYVPISNFEMNKDEKKVIVTGLGITNTATYSSPEFGCTIESSLEIK